MQKRIYLDWNASSPLSKNAFLAMKSTFANFANPSSSHYEGRAAKKAIEKARDNIAEMLGLNTRFNVVFTSGATESINQCIIGAVHFYSHHIHNVKYDSIHQ